MSKSARTTQARGLQLAVSLAAVMVSLFACSQKASAANIIDPNFKPQPPAQMAGPKWHYVSSAAPVGNNDGTTWQKAWPTFSSIDWSKIEPGDSIIIDGGARWTNYNDVLEIKKSGTDKYPITIQTSTAPGRNGVVAIRGDNLNRQYGIDTQGHYHLRIQGHAYARNTDPLPINSLTVSNFQTAGVIVDGQAYDVQLKNIDITRNGQLGEHCGGGLLVEGYCSQATNLNVFNNTPQNVDVSTNSRGGFTLTNSWVYNDYLWDRDGFRSPYGEGIRIRNGFVGTDFLDFHIENCVVGPNLTKGIVLGQQNSHLMIKNSLLLNAETANVTREGAGDFNNKNIHLRDVTSFMTPLNSSNQGHSCLDFTRGRFDAVFESIVYGGTVQVAGTVELGRNNVQYRTSGNTMMLSPFQIDPMFITDVSAFQPNVSMEATAKYRTDILNADFAPNASSPARSIGSTLRSIRQMSSYQHR